MNTRQYYIALSTICMSIFLSPGIESLLRVYLIAIVWTVSAFIGLLFRWKQLREYIVKRIMVDVMEELFLQKSLSEFQQMITMIGKREKNDSGGKQ